jgi:hypothetical protein
VEGMRWEARKAWIGADICMKFKKVWDKLIRFDQNGSIYVL